jgi:hypothetical protein
MEAIKRKLSMTVSDITLEFIAGWDVNGNKVLKLTPTLLQVLTSTAQSAGKNKIKSPEMASLICQMGFTSNFKVITLARGSLRSPEPSSRVCEEWVRSQQGVGKYCVRSPQGVLEDFLQGLCKNSMRTPYILLAGSLHTPCAVLKDSDPSLGHVTYQKMNATSEN